MKSIYTYRRMHAGLVKATKFRFTNCNVCQRMVQLSGKQRTCHECRRDPSRGKTKAKGK